MAPLFPGGGGEQGNEGPCFDYTLMAPTAAQRDHFETAIRESLYPWKRVPVDLTVRWITDPSAELHNELAETHWDAPMGTERSVCYMDIKDQFPAQFDTFNWHVEIIFHELGHVLQSRINTQMRNDLVKLFERNGKRGTPDDWKAPDYNTGTNTWRNSIQEAFAETIKDIYLPQGLRASGNRTAWRLPSGEYERFFTVIDGICCPPGGAT